jgi:hypothetical protein
LQKVKDEDKMLSVPQQPDGRLDLAKVFLEALGESAGRTAPAMVGEIVDGWGHYQSVPVETFISGDVMVNVEEEYEVRFHCSSNPAYYSRLKWLMHPLFTHFLCLCELFPLIERKRR